MFLILMQVMNFILIKSNIVVILIDYALNQDYFYFASQLCYFFVKITYN